ncbi:YobA family protein [Paenisporosarcina sp. NPDC076898]|uniref:YobA family protein n=1 Tax=unclassified Paenisporosarcina TaxID=2642018 RepID=UPI003D03209D
MKGKKAVLMIVAIALVSIAAVVISISVFFQNNQTQNENASWIEGTVAQKEDARILVISGKDEAELKDLTEEEMLEGASEAIWFSLSIDQAKKVSEFDTVRISYSHVSETYPGQASATSVLVIDEESQK